MGIYNGHADQAQIVYHTYEVVAVWFISTPFCCSEIYAGLETYRWKHSRSDVQIVLARIHWY